MSRRAPDVRGRSELLGQQGKLLDQISEYIVSRCDKNQYDFGRKTD